MSVSRLRPNMNRLDPYDPPSEYIFECRQCGAHIQASERMGTCANCGGAVKNITVPRE